MTRRVCAPSKQVLLGRRTSVIRSPPPVNDSMCTYWEWGLPGREGGRGGMHKEWDLPGGEGGGHV